MSKDSPVSPMVAPTTAPNEPSGSAPSLRLRSWSRTVPATVRPPSRGGVLDLGALLVGGEGEDEHAGAVLARGVEHRGQGAEPEEGAGGDGVGGER